MKQTIKIPEITDFFSYKELFEMSSESAWSVWVKIPAAIAEVYGWDVANKIITTVCERDAAPDAEFALDTLKLKNKDATDCMIALLWVWKFFTPGVNVEIVEASQKRAVGRVDKCTQLELSKQSPPPWWKGNVEKFGMKQLCPPWWDKFAKTVNPKLKTSYNKMQCPPKKDKCCEFVCEKLD